MFGKSKKKPKVPSIPALEEACARNVPLEVFRSAGPGAPPAARGRLLYLDEAKVYVERTRDQEGEVNLEARQDIDCFFSHRGDLYVFRTEVVDPKCSAPLNGQHRVPAIALGRPGKVEQGQRRSRYRVSFASMFPPTKVRLGLIVDGIEPAHDEDWWECELADASIYGLGLVIEGASPRDFVVRTPATVRYYVPGEGSATILRAEIRRVQEISATGGVRLGLQFEPWPDHAEFDKRLEPFDEYLARFQRDRMRRASA